MEKTEVIKTSTFQMPKEQLLDSTWSDAVSNDPKHRPQVMDFSESIPDLSAIEAELQSHAPDSFLLVLPKKICQKHYAQWCDLLFKTLRRPRLTLRYGVSAKVLGESIYDKSSGKIYILGIKNASNTKVWMKFNVITNNEYNKTA